MLKILTNPFVVITLLFIFFTAKFALTREYPVIQEVNITYSDDIGSYVNTFNPRSGEKHYAFIVGYQNINYRSLDEEYQGVKIPEDYIKGDYFKNLKMLYATNNCEPFNNQTLCTSTHILDGEYYSNKFKKSVKLSENKSSTWKFMVSYGRYVAYSLGYVFSISILIFISWYVKRIKRMSYEIAYQQSLERLK